ncbi:hypothetical protein Pmani_020318 [Petrolisthes manimaculis]|uniref:Armadillo repeat-containing protein 2 n=1 Tax=Petrolisthes manimaculis TaxID=1843537 RepID=A0AAE1PH27_9EUCA|nr:hypothetical protein Pmani_020318 [Petrolisthes manimaculis]
MSQAVERRRDNIGGCTGDVLSPFYDPPSQDISPDYPRGPLSPLHFDSNDTSGKSSATPARLVPLPEDGKTKLPALVSSRRVQRHQFRTLSLLPEESEECVSDDEGIRTTRKATTLLPRSYTITSLHSLAESQEEEEEEEEEGGDRGSSSQDNNNKDGRGYSEESHLSSPSPESRPDNVVKQVGVGVEGSSGPQVTSSPLFQQLLNSADMELSDLESSLKLKREFKNSPAFQPTTDPTLKNSSPSSSQGTPESSLGPLKPTSTPGEMKPALVKLQPLSTQPQTPRTPGTPQLALKSPQGTLQMDHPLQSTWDSPHSVDATPTGQQWTGRGGRRSVSKRAGVTRDWRHAVEARTTPTASQEEEEGRGDEERQSEETVRKEQDPPVDQTLYYEEKVAPILDEINRALTCGQFKSCSAGSGGVVGCVGVEEGVLGELVGKVYVVLEAGGLLGRHFRYRSQVLRAVFRLVDREHGPLLAAIARVMLALKVSGSNLTSVCKLVFKVTRHDVNDALFLEGNLLDLLLEAVACVPPLEQPEACVYGYGALKFLTMNSQLVSRLLNRGVLELLVLHMKLIVNHQQESGKVPEQTHYALVQLTGTLRHVSSCQRTFPLLLMTGAVPQVCSLLHHFSHDQDVTANVVRILSIISTHEDCCAAAASHPATMPAAVAALRKHADSPAIVVRLAYALGNMMANSDEARWKLFSEPGFTEALLELLTDYLQRDRHAQAGDLSDPLTSASATPEDVMVKLIRVLANVSVHPRVGPLLARSRTCLGLLTSVLQHKGLAGSEELVLSALATLNNLTFYTRHQPVSVVHTDLAECLCELLPMDHIEGLVETIRVFGNLTHFKEVRDILTKRAVLEVLVEMLDCDSRELVYVCAGVLVNLMSDASRRSIFGAENGVLRMIDVLQYFGYGDWQLCNLGCQVLWNFCASAADAQEVLGHKETEKLIYVLEEFLDDDSYFNNPEVFGEVDPDVRDAAYQLWEDFASVATKLLDRIEDNESSLPVVPAS